MGTGFDVDLHQDLEGIVPRTSELATLFQTVSKDLTWNVYFFNTMLGERHGSNLVKKKIHPALIYGLI